jgi:formyltetrahydrofolate hydrolase
MKFNTPIKVKEVFSSLNKKLMDSLSSEKCNDKFNKLNQDVNKINQDVTKLNEDVNKLSSELNTKTSIHQSSYNYEELFKLISKQDHELNELRTDIKFLAMAVGILLLAMLISFTI